ncbi:DsbA family protein [Sandaracinobacteroides hominis]|uniref:DsbA family protein n=1 Tax=Sandaracinobacteroides hominis TaxID=2780086 RepID=UPI0018F2DF92|nr:thioredoxin domain-containing protein [Sandaracinobacteroides hominis]
MTNMLKVSLLLAATLAVAACDSGTSTAAPAGKAADAAKSSPAARDWTQTVVETPEGGYRMGNPDAKVKVVEFASFTCSHCRDFHKEAETTFKPTYVKTGQVSYEYRPFMLNVYDFAAVKLATCEGPSRFFTWANELYTHSDAWITPFTKLTEADVAPLRALPPGEQIKGLATAGQLHEFAKTRGLPRAKFDGCMSDQKTLDTLTARQQAAVDKFQVQGTPTFLLNGKKLEGVANWATLEPKLKEAL